MPGRTRTASAPVRRQHDAERYGTNPEAPYPYHLPLFARPAEGPRSPDPDPQVTVIEPGVIVRFTVSVTLICGHRITTDPIGIGSYWFHRPTARSGGAYPYGQAVNPAVLAAIAAHTACEETP